MNITATSTAFFSSSAARININYSGFLNGGGKPTCAPDGFLTIQRTCTSGPNSGFVDTIAQNAPLDQFWFDFGDAVRADGSTISPPLLAGTYIYSVTAETGGQTYTAQTAPLAVGNAIIQIPDGMTALFIAAVDANLRAAPWPAGKVTAPPIVFNDMPPGSFDRLPIVTVNLEHIKQNIVPISQQAMIADQDNKIVLPEYATRTWRIHIMSTDAVERDTIRDYLIGSLKVIAFDLFTPLGGNNNHRHMTASYSKGGEDAVPGTYHAEIIYETVGNYHTVVQTGYPYILSISPDLTVKAPPNFSEEVNS